MSNEIESYIASHPNDLILLTNNKIKCLLTNHEMKPDLSVYLKFKTGKAYTAALKNKNLKLLKLDNYPYIIEHKKDNTKVYCKLTSVILNKNEDEIKKHIAGHLYQLKLQSKNNKSKKKKEKSSGNQEENGFWAPDVESDDESESDIDINDKEPYDSDLENEDISDDSEDVSDEDSEDDEDLSDSGSEVETIEIPEDAGFETVKEDETNVLIKRKLDDNEDEDDISDLIALQNNNNSKDLKTTSRSMKNLMHTKVAGKVQAKKHEQLKRAKLNSKK